MSTQSPVSGSRIFMLPTTITDENLPVHCVFSFNQVVEVLGPEGLCHLPHAPKAMPAVVHYYGRLLPVLYLETALGSQSVTPKQLIILRTGLREGGSGDNIKVAVATSSVLRLTRFDNATDDSQFQLRQAPQGLQDCGFLEGYFTIEQGTSCAALLDLDGLARGTTTQVL